VELMGRDAPARDGWTPVQQALVWVSLVVGVLVRFVALGSSVLTFDESFTAEVARRPLGEIAGVLRDTDSHPPLDYVIRHLVVSTDSTFWLRLPSAVFGVSTLAVVLWWMWGRGWFGAMVVALSSVAAIEVLYSRQARMYALVILAGTVVAAVAERWLVEPRARWSVIAALALLVGSSAHVSVVVLGLGALVLPLARTDRAAWIWRGAVLGAVAVWGAAWGPSFLEQRQHEHASWIPFTTPRTAVEAVSGQLSLYDGLAVLLFVTIVAGGALLLRRGGPLGRVWLCLFAAPAAALVVLGLRAHLLLPRTLAFGAWAPVVAVAALVAVLIEPAPGDTVLRSPAVRGVGLVVVLALAVPSVRPAATYEEDSAPARRWMIDHVEPGDVVAVHPRFLGPMVAWDHGVRGGAPVTGLEEDDVWTASVPGAAPTGRAWVLVPDTYTYAAPVGWQPCADVPDEVVSHYGVVCLDRT
jgi:hypothetical protein